MIPTARPTLKPHPQASSAEAVSGNEECKPNTCRHAQEIVLPLLQKYLAALSQPDDLPWEKLGDPEWDDLISTSEYAAFLARKVSQELDAAGLLRLPPKVV